MAAEDSTTPNAEPTPRARSRSARSPRAAWPARTAQLGGVGDDRRWSLRWPDVDLDRGRMDITTSIVQLGWEAAESTPKTDASDATVALDKGTVRALKAWRKIQLADKLRWGSAWTDTGRVFTTELGEALHPDRITDVFEWAAFQAGLPPIRLHDLRHGAASIAHRSGADMKAISHLLRHSSISITADTYTSIFEEADGELAETMSQAVPRMRAVGDSDETDAPTTRPRKLRGPYPPDDPRWL
ncbi:MAG TPA: site-specific integrase [Streptosporangiaceae bacterium]|nr:site-specific integrase [Streptosporangiaceae bacterium]